MVKVLKVGTPVVIAKDAELFFAADRHNVIHEVTDVVTGGYRIAPVSPTGVDWSRVIGAMTDEVREVR